MSFTHRLFHLVWSCSQNGFLKLSYRTLEAKSWCSFSKYNDYALFQSIIAVCVICQRRRNILKSLRKKNLSAWFSIQRKTIKCFDHWTFYSIERENYKVFILKQFFLWTCWKFRMYFDSYRAIIITVIMAIISQDWNINLCFF